MKSKVLYFGTFAPFHLGHESVIKNLSKQFDDVIIVVSGYDGDRGDLFGLNLEIRYQLLSSVLPFNEVVKVDESNIERYPDGWDAWLDLLESKVGSLSDFVIVSGEFEYDIVLKSKGYETLFVDRNIIKISATSIRNNFSEFSEFCNYSFKSYIEEHCGV